MQVQEWLAGWSVAATGLGALVFWITATAAMRYDLVGWTLPAGTEAANLRMRRYVAAALGAGAVAVASMSMRAPLVCQCVLMGAAAVSDFARFRLPLPLTVGGMVYALAVTRAADLPFAVIEAAVFLLLLRMLRADVGGGDAMAAVWIVLAAPWHGAAAICIGHATWLMAARICDPQRMVRRAPIGGAWLLAAAWLLPLAWRAV